MLNGQDIDNWKSAYFFNFTKDCKQYRGVMYCYPDGGFAFGNHGGLRRYSQEEKLIIAQHIKENS